MESLGSEPDTSLCKSLPFSYFKADMENQENAFINHRFAIEINGTKLIGKLVAVNNDSFYFIRMMELETKFPMGGVLKFQAENINHIWHWKPPFVENTMDLKEIDTLKGANMDNIILFLDYEDEVFTQINAGMNNGVEIRLEFKGESVQSFIISNLYDNFPECIEQLLNSDIVSLALHGISIGSPRGKCCWISFAIDNNIFHFDLISLGNQAFKRGLKSLLENNSIIKIVYDSAFIYEALKQDFGVNMVNVFDIKIADVMHRKDMNLKESLNMRSLHKILKSNLGAEIANLVNPPFPIDIRDGFEIVAWLQRPMKYAYRTIICKELFWLLDLRRLYVDIFEERTKTFIKRAQQYFSGLQRGFFANEMEKGLDCKKLFAPIPKKTDILSGDEYVDIPDDVYFNRHAANPPEVYNFNNIAQSSKPEEKRLSVQSEFKESDPIVENAPYFMPNRNYDDVEHLNIMPSGYEPIYNSQKSKGVKKVQKQNYK